ncbi:hypothetical protein [Mesorhizobium marinum]|uniref:Uncharacterized protein n=1 Tax=Mesorhizobium marinum TaxID=3228790 RepID=A0ABV3R2J6_9HYPH
MRSFALIVAALISTQALSEDGRTFTLNGRQYAFHFPEEYKFVERRNTSSANGELVEFSINETHYAIIFSAQDQSIDELYNQFSSDKTKEQIEKFYSRDGDNYFEVHIAEYDEKRSLYGFSIHISCYSKCNFSAAILAPLDDPRLGIDVVNSLRAQVKGLNTH